MWPASDVYLLADKFDRAAVAMRIVCGSPQTLSPKLFLQLLETQPPAAMTP